MNFPVVEIFHSIQGEGKYTGYPSIFIRVTGCNLRCVFKGSICDTAYTSFNPEKPLYNTPEETYKALEKIVKKYPNTRHVVFTGGEPMLYREGIKKLVEMIDDNTADKSNKYIYTIETNGTLPPIDPWSAEDFGYMHVIDLHSVSPKLSTSVDHNLTHLTEEQRNRHNRLRINIDSLAEYAMRFITPGIGATQFKFVYSGEESVKEIKDILYMVDRKLWQIDECGIDNDCVLLMPEGTTNNQLNNIQQECVEVCCREGWRFCDRLHIRIWGDKRGV